MKKFFLFVACVATALGVSAAPTEVTFDKLPENSQEFIRRNFPSEKIQRVEMDRESSWDKYTVFFDSGNQVSFEGGSGDCSQIVMKNGSIPMSLIPNKVRAYMSGKYPGQKVVMMQTTADGYRLRLADNTDLDFDKDGTFVKAAK